MLSVYIQEQKYYSEQELCQLFAGLPKEKVISIWQSLQEKGLVKIVKKEAVDKDLTELAQEDVVEKANETELQDYRFVCNFVGVIMVQDVALKCYPKYIASSDGLLEKMCLVIQVLHKYRNRKQDLNFFDIDANQRFNLLTVMLALLFDYYQYGLYTKEQIIREINGNGEILWEPTVNKSLVLFNQGRPIYTELITRKRVSDEESFIRRVHAWVLRDCSERLAKAELLDLFGLNPVEEECCELEELGEKEYLVKRLQQEMCSQFNTRKQQLLQLLRAYIEEDSLRSETSGITIYGTRKFDMVWQEACAWALGNVLEKSSLELGVAVQGSFADKGRIALNGIIEKPSITLQGATDGEYSKGEGNLLKPDIVTLAKNGNAWRMDIYDAKYYLSHVDAQGKLQNLPGIGDITKEFLYELVYGDYRLTHGIKMGRNAFVFPMENSRNVFLRKGEIRMKMFANLGLKPIDLLFADAASVFECYVKGMKIKKATLEELDKKDTIMTNNQQTLNYYNAHAQDFVQGTVDVDFHITQDRFLSKLPAGAKILDFGCGSGRDAKYFLERGFAVQATDGSAELCKFASEYTGIKVRQMLFNELDVVDEFDGIWACASILHLAWDELVDVLQRIARAVKAGGVVYTSFKYGQFSGERNGRFFTDLDEEGLERLLAKVPQLKVKEMWITGDVRPGRGEEKWLNLLLQRT